MVPADELLSDLARMAAKYGRRYEQHRRSWRESPVYEKFTDARYWMQEAAGGRNAIARTMAKLQPGGRFRKGDHVRVRRLLSWLHTRAERANKEAHGPYTETRRADEAESAYADVIHLVLSEYGVGISVLKGDDAPPAEPL